MNRTTLSWLYIGFICLYFVSCTKSSEEKNASADSLSTDSANTAVVDALADSSSKISFSSNGSSFNIRIDTAKKIMNVFNGNEQTPFQVIDFSEAFENMSFSDFFKRPTAYTELEDLNFDGYQDLKIPSNQGSGGIWYDVYLYDPAVKKFIRNKELGEMASLWADSANKTIYMRSVGGWAGAIYNARMYQWKNNKPYMLREDSQGLKDINQEPDTITIFIRTISERNDKGDMSLSCQVEIREPENGPSQYCLIKGEWKPLEQDQDFIKEVEKGTIIKSDGRNNPCW
jgi:hypothetical protein